MSMSLETRMRKKVSVGPPNVITDEVSSDPRFYLRTWYSLAMWVTDGGTWPT